MCSFTIQLHRKRGHSARWLMGLLVACVLLVISGRNLYAMTVNDTTGWINWTTAAGVAMTDPLADAQTGQGPDDFVGSIKQQAGTIGGVQSIMWQAQVSSYDSKGYNGNITLGIDLNDDGAIDLLMMMSDKTAGQTSVQTFTFATPGTGANNSPSTTSWGTFQGSITLASTNYSYAAVPSTDTSYGTKTNAYVTFAISYANLQAAIRAYAGSAFASYTLDDMSHLSFIAFTTTQGNAINQDLFGTSGNMSSSVTFADLGAGTALIRPGGGNIPEPAAAMQMGCLLGFAYLGCVWRRKRCLRSRSVAH